LEFGIWNLEFGISELNVEVSHNPKQTLKTDNSNP
jgi:hypothetical protein